MILAPPILTPVAAGQRLRARTINDLQDAVRNVYRGLPATLYPVLPTPAPWDWLTWKADTLVATFRMGYIEIATDDGTLYLESSTGLDPTVTLSDGDNWVYATITNPATGATYSLAVAATLGAVDSTATSWAKLLWRITLDGYSVTNQVRFACTNLEGPMWRPEP